MMICNVKGLMETPEMVVELRALPNSALWNFFKFSPLFGIFLNRNIHNDQSRRPPTRAALQTLSGRQH
jgi:hypothetical protein